MNGTRLPQVETDPERMNQANGKKEIKEDNHGDNPRPKTVHAKTDTWQKSFQKLRVCARHLFWLDAGFFCGNSGVKFAEKRKLTRDQNEC